MGNVLREDGNVNFLWSFDQVNNRARTGLEKMRGSVGQRRRLKMGLWACLQCLELPQTLSFPLVW